MSSLTNAKDTTITRLRVQPIDQRNDDDLFSNPLWPTLMSPQALTFVGIYNATVGVALTALAAGATASLYLDAASGLASGTYLVFPVTFSLPSGLLLATNKLFYSVGQGRLNIEVVNATAAAITVAAATTIEFAILRLDTNE